MANEGFIKLYRKMLEWGWYDDGPTKDVFIHLLLIASYEDKFYRGVPLERGQVVTTVKEMEVKLGLTTRQIRTALNKLISTNEVTKKATSKFTVYTINNYADYQVCDKQNDKRATNERQTSDKPSNTKKVRSKEIKNISPYNPPQGDGTTARPRFTPPSLSEVSAYCRERQNMVDPQRFIDYYTANGWKVGKNSMKDWKAAVRTWESKQKSNAAPRRQDGRDFDWLTGQ